MNPALGVAHQLFSAIIDPENAKAGMMVILLFPSLLGGAIAGYVMKNLYEPMLLYTRFKHELDIEEQNHQNGQEEVQQQNHD